MAIGLSTGGFPSKLIVPVMVEAAVATPGENSTATSPAANHNLVPDPPMLGSLVMQTSRSAQEIALCARLYTKTRYAGNAIKRFQT
jgi:hypothetical protein